MHIRAPRKPLDELTARQREVMSLIAKGRTNPEIATELGMTIDGAKWHVREILGKLGVDSREEAVREWRTRRNAASRLAIVLGGGLAASAAAVVVGVALWVAFSGNDGTTRAAPTAAASATANVLHIATSSATSVPSGPPIDLSDAIAKLPASEGTPMAAYDGKLIVLTSTRHFDEHANPQSTYDETFQLWDPVTGKSTPLWTMMGSISNDYVTSVDGDWAAVVGTWGDDASAWRLSLHNLRTGEAREIATQQKPALDSGVSLGGVVSDGHVYWSQTELTKDGTAQQQLESYSIADAATTTISHSGPLAVEDGRYLAQGVILAGAPAAGGGKVAWVDNRTANGTRTLDVLDVATGLITHPATEPGIVTYALSDDGRYLAWSDSADVSVLDLSTRHRASVALGDAPSWSGDDLSWYAQNSTAGFYDTAANTVRLVDQPQNTGSNVGQVMGHWFVWQIFPSDRSNDGYWAIIPVK